jgi:hypothetical protein
MADLANGRRFALHEAYVDADTVRGRERRRLDGGLAELCSDAATGNAVPRSSPRADPSKLDRFMTPGDPDYAQCSSSRER